MRSAGAPSPFTRKSAGASPTPSWTCGRCASSRIDHPVDLGGGITIKWRSAPSYPSLVGSISNQTPYDIEGCRLLADGAGGVEIGRVPRGGSVDLAQRYWQQGPFTYQHFAGLLKGDDAVPRIQRAIFESLGQQGQGESTRLIGWIRQPLFGLTVDGRPARETNVHLISVVQ